MGWIAWRHSPLKYRMLFREFLSLDFFSLKNKITEGLALTFISAFIVSPRLSPGAIELCTHQFGDSLKKANMTKDEFKNAVIQAKEHILSGDIFQIVLSQRFERRTFADPFEVYRALRVVNPSPYMTYLQVCYSKLPI